VLAQCAALTHLDLSYNDITAAGAENLAGVLGQCASLTVLNLDYNSLDLSKQHTKRICIQDQRLDLARAFFVCVCVRVRVCVRVCVRD